MSISYAVEAAEHLASFHDQIRAGDVQNGMDGLFHFLRSRRLASSTHDWAGFVQSECLPHPLRLLVHQDPFTWRCFSKPRGFAGDAVMLDHIYSSGQIAADDPQVSELGKAINKHTAGLPAARAVRYRRDYIAHLIDSTEAATRRPHILSIACGHARELELSRAAANGRLGQFVALDQDVESLQVVRQKYGSGVTTVQGSVRGILSGKPAFSGQHLVYASGLYDYLSQEVAIRLTSVMFDMLAPGGKVLVANFLPNIHDVGYMESYMAWSLVYRTREQLMTIGDHFADRARTEFHLDDDENIGFLTITKC